MLTEIAVDGEDGESRRWSGESESEPKRSCDDELVCMHLEGERSEVGGVSLLVYRKAKDGSWRTIDKISLALAFL